MLFPISLSCCGSTPEFLKFISFLSVVHNHCLKDLQNLRRFFFIYSAFKYAMQMQMFACIFSNICFNNYRMGSTLTLLSTPLLMNNPV